MKQSNNCKQDNKGLQKFTNLDSLKTVEDFKALLERDPGEFGKVGELIMTKVNEAMKDPNPDVGIVDYYYSRLEHFLESEDRSPDYMETVRRDRWHANKARIEQTITNYILEQSRLPTPNEIMSKTGLSRVTISKHLKEGVGADYYRAEVETYRLLTTRVLAALYNQGMKRNDVRALKVFLDYFKGEGSGTTIRTQNNYLQVNNTRIDAITINQLPADARAQIEQIINQYQPTTA
jgi:hypothetical protein